MKIILSELLLGLEVGEGDSGFVGCVDSHRVAEGEDGEADCGWTRQIGTVNKLSASSQILAKVGEDADR